MKNFNKLDKQIEADSEQDVDLSSMTIDQHAERIKALTSETQSLQELLATKLQLLEAFKALRPVANKIDVSATLFKRATSAGAGKQFF